MSYTLVQKKIWKLILDDKATKSQPVVWPELILRNIPPHLIRACIILWKWT